MSGRSSLRFLLASVPFAAALLTSPTAVTQTAAVDFRRDVQPILRANCYGCHGPSKQMNSFRLDRRSRALRGGTQTVIIPGNSAASRLYLRLIGNQFGAPMPPSGRLDADDVAIIKTWIDQGAQWPDDLANEVDVAPADPRALKAIAMLRAGQFAGFRDSVAADAALLNRRGVDGATPFMFAALYGDAPLIEWALDRGADLNARNDTGATALIWVGDDLAKARVLTEHGADVNARSDDGRTPLFVAAGINGTAAVVRYLLDKGAKANALNRSPNDATPLRMAAAAGDAEVVKLLVDHGADIKAAGQQALVQAAASGCDRCLAMIVDGFEKRQYSQALLAISDFGDTKNIRLMLDHGADVNARDPDGRTALIFAAASDHQPVDAVSLLLERGADVAARTSEGLTALDYARLHGETPVAKLLEARGAPSGSSHPAPASAIVANNTVRAAVQRSLPTLQRADVSFMQKTGCISCHNDSLTAITVGTARAHGFAVDESASAGQVHETVAMVDRWRERMLQGIAQGGGSGTVAYILVGLGAENHPPDLVTDAVARFIRQHQMPDGRWATGPSCSRPPLCGGQITQTANAMRGLQLYAPAAFKADYDAAVRLAARWLANAKAVTNEDRAYRVLGLAWAGTLKAALKTAVADLLAAQRGDGGWSDIATLPSGAYATGQSLVALNEAGVAPTDPAYQRGVEFLLKTQREDGSWYVRSRSIPIQPYFDNGFPHGRDQWISGAATNWATQALARASRSDRQTTAGGR